MTQIDNIHLTLSHLYESLDKCCHTQPLGLDVDVLLELSFWNSYLEAANGFTGLNDLLRELQMFKGSLASTLIDLVHLVISFSYTKNKENFYTGLSQVKSSLTAQNRGFSLQCLEQYITICN
jgi:hypothetical protein